MPILAPGRSISEVLISTSQSTTGKPRSLLMVTTRSTSGTTADNTAVTVADTTELSAKIGAVPGVSLESFKRMRAIAPTAQIWVIAGKDPATTPTETQNLVAGIQAITRNSQLPLSGVVVPQVAMLAAQADRTTCYTNLESACSTNGWDFVAFINTGQVTDTKAKADTEVALYSSPQGNMVPFFGFEASPLNETQQLPLCVAAMATQIQLFETEIGFRPPADIYAPIGNVDPKYFLSLADAEAVMIAKTYNFPWSLGGKNYLWNDCTLATDEGWDYINSRWGMSWMQSVISEALNGIQFSPADPNPDSDGFGVASRELQGRLAEAGEKGKREGAIVDYRLDVLPFAAGKSRASFKVQPIRSQRFIEILLINTQNVNA